jgi:anti-sigma regulatory factor (Ser/Thr protein kinase)
MVTAISNLDKSRRLLLHNDLAELERLAGWIDGWAGELVSPDTSFAIQLCLEEAVANIIMYGPANDDQLEIAVELEHSGSTVVARVEDTGREFDPTRFPPAFLATSLEEAEVGDLGIHLMRRFASEMDYERRDCRNRLTLRFVGSEATSRQHAL